MISGRHRRPNAAAAGATFEQIYRCYPTSYLDKPQLENGDKVIMPQSALHLLVSLQIDYPMLFQLHNAATNRTTHCGVLEFVAEEGIVFLPPWMMKNMMLQDGDILQVKNATLPKATYVKLQPHTMDFLDIADPKTVLEMALRSFSCLTVGDTIMVAHNNKKYYIDIKDAKPAAAVTVIETDCEVDFAPPLDYKEPPRAAAGGKNVHPSADAASQSKKKGGADLEEGGAEGEPKFTVFTGAARRIDGKPVTQNVSEQRSSQKESAAGGTGSRGRAAGKLVFGGSNSGGGGAAAAANRGGKKAAAAKGASKEQRPNAKDEAQQNKFQAFSGKKYSLRD